MRVCVGTSCYLRGAHNLLQKILAGIEEHELQDAVNVQATFCMETCELGPSVAIGNRWLRSATYEKVMEEINGTLEEQKKHDARVTAS